MTSDFREAKQFESEVLRIARALWPSAEYSGSQIVEGQERDGMFATEDCIHIVEATISRRKAKAESDAGKINSLMSDLRKKHPSMALKGWFVTKEEPEADQRAAVQRKGNSGIICLSFEQFKARLIDARSYLDCRSNYAFGSVRDPDSGSLAPAVEYVELDLLDANTQELSTIDEVALDLAGGGRFVLLGDYGAGKSMTLRKLFQVLRRRYYRGQTRHFPVYINLRDNMGLVTASEVLDRHAKNIGFGPRSHLIRAWRAGYVTLILDGFDEITTYGIRGLWKKLSDARYRSLQAVRELVREHPSNVGLVMAGRAHFFDSTSEMSRALNVNEQFSILTLNEFTKEQIRSYLSKVNFEGEIPAWLPSRPLLVGYLASKGLLTTLLRAESAAQSRDPSIAWNTLLTEISNREAQIEAGIDGSTVRAILERLATRARKFESALGPLSAKDLLEVFQEVTGYPPDESAILLLQRLPGLGVIQSGNDVRGFIDRSFADVAAAGDISRSISRPWDVDWQIFTGLTKPLGHLGAGVAVVQTASHNASEGQLEAVAERCQEHDCAVALADFVHVGALRNWEVRQRIQVRDILIDSLDLSGEEEASCLRQVEYRDCYIRHIELAPTASSDQLPKLRECYISELEGPSSMEDLPQGFLDKKCHVERLLSTSETTDKILELNVPLGVRVCLTVLRKLFFRPGAGRRESALSRGLDGREQRAVGKVLQVVRSEGLATPYRGGDGLLWIPDRSQTARVGKMLSGPTTTDDSCIERCREISG